MRSSRLWRQAADVARVRGDAETCAMAPAPQLSPMPASKPRRIRVSIREEPIAELAKQAAIGVAFRVDHAIDITPSPGGRGVVLLLERPIPEPWIKDYDAIPGNAPADWPSRFDTTRWALLGAYSRDERVGGAVVAPFAPGSSLTHEPGVAVLWDLRVAEARRGQGIGAQLFKAAESWARARGC